ncbi:MAG: hypothetical protein A3A98_01010 [Candidatus Staskawiczbacteria bacterium RIFCSPLOWO2_01_FULL_40_39]|uniref:Response regulatory domain-containing protein n=1 Tax=Candidatus Staskawiczbacteria bacterium RIFCSPHIGHO2_01_FULL_39_25 TaxID=1802202 RepID=A0A1G2HMU8_9BACT|nr:MAG: hypothetical protein A2730_01010 [Candidatus Staskawiczbacteria bacterium RIFCSPHIGHO2_01_FULL_39_25]OGZ73310.1 MAG: hypothetical protein A3A98_01010 [Candidatus Staskawiczbacteria bacterium RIFCSPLOWO2_01_FULL_40_39]OGZ75066.1 MAG: hypothetical protein A3I87_01285 [Candidatus Staskawiczbacteria bacterium RIFCSPLOWO2_02_FULL_39_8]
MESANKPSGRKTAEGQKKVLIVEDEKSLLAVLKEEFESEGFLVVTALDGQEGLQAVDKENPDLVLLDIAMPKMDGLTMIEALKSKGKDIPTIILTNLDDLNHISKSVALGPFDYLIKSDWKLQEIVKRAKMKLGI